jgi:hypothetical protein
MREPLVKGPAAIYAAIGAVGLARPASVPALFGGAAGTPAARTEIRAVYGGFLLALAGTILAASRAPARIRTGLLASAAAASAGMALGRTAGALAERELSPWPTGAFLAIEAGLAGALLVALRA